MAIRKFLDLSTAHVTKETARLLDAKLCYAVNTGTGWFIFVLPENPDVADLAAVFDLARKSDCDYVLMDCDADVLEELPSWDW